MKTSSTGIDFIKQSESCHLEAYKALEAESSYTIGWGHYGVAEGTRWTQKQADDQLMLDVNESEAIVNDYVKGQANQNEFDALVSFIYNCGNVIQSDHWESFSHDYVANVLPLYIYGNGVVLQGLIKRRNEELKQFNQPVVIQKQKQEVPKHPMGKALPVETVKQPLVVTTAQPEQLFDWGVILISVLVILAFITTIRYKNTRRRRKKQMTKTIEQVRTFLDSKVGTITKDNSNHALDGQCVSLAKNLLDFLGVSNPYGARGNAKDIPTSYLAEGIARSGYGTLNVVVNRNGGGGYGHVWVRVGSDNWQANYIDFPVKKNYPQDPITDVINLDQWLTKSDVKYTPAIQTFMNNGDKFKFVKDIRVDEIKKFNGIYQFVNYDLAGSKAIDWVNNGIPLDLVDNITRGNEQNTLVGDMVRFKPEVSHGTIDQYDNASNGVGITYDGYGVIWYSADALLNRF